jgi:hypothetical protein
MDRFARHRFVIKHFLPLWQNCNNASWVKICELSVKLIYNLLAKFNLRFLLPSGEDAVCERTQLARVARRSGTRYFRRYEPRLRDFA